MFAGLLDVVDKIEWAESAPRQRDRRSRFLLRRGEDGAEGRVRKRPVRSVPSMLLLPAPAAQNGRAPSKNFPEKTAQKSATGAICASAAPGLARSGMRMAGAGLCRMASCLNPATAIGYIHILLNAFVLAAVLYIVSYLLYFITVDVIYKIHLRKEEARAVIAEARRLYIINRCDPATRVPALETQCGEWDCIARNGLSGIRYTKIVVEVVADVLEGFVSKFSLRSYGVFALLLTVYLLFRR